MISLQGSTLTGQTPSTSLLQALLTPPSGSTSDGSQPRSINFAQFLTLFGQKLLELDTEQEILDAFACFDEDDDGLIDVPRSKGRMSGQDEELDRVGEPAGLRGWLKEYGDRMTDKEVSRERIVTAPNDFLAHHGALVRSTVSSLGPSRTNRSALTMSSLPKLSRSTMPKM